MQMRIAVLLGLFVIRAAAAPEPSARTAPCLAAELADDVFVGRVLGITPNQARVPHILLDTWSVNPSLRIRFAVAERFKGVGLSTREMDVFADGQNLPYELPFRLGDSYLVYARREGTDWVIEAPTPKWVDVASRPLASRPAAESLAALQFLRSTSGLPERHDVTGFVEDAYPVNQGLLPWAPPAAYALAQWLVPASWAHIFLRGISLRLEDPGGGEHVALSNGAGEFRFGSVPVGIYQLRFDDANIAALPNPIHVVPGGCRVLSLQPHVAHGVVGHLSTQAGEPNSGVELELVRDRNPCTWGGCYRTETNEMGDFDFEDVAPGDYRLGVSVEAASGLSHPYDRQLYPQLLHVVSSPKPLRVEFQLNTRARQGGKLVKVSLLGPDGTPVQFARINQTDSHGGQVELIDFDPIRGTYSFVAFPGSNYPIVAQAPAGRFDRRFHGITYNEVQSGRLSIVLRPEGNVDLRDR